MSRGVISITSADSQVSETEYAAIHRSWIPETCDLLITIVGSLGRCALVDGTEGRFTFQRSVAILRPNPAVIHPRYLFHAVRGDAFQRALLTHANATAQAGVYLGALAALAVPAPSLNEQRRIAKILDAADDEIRGSEALIAKLRSAKKGLLTSLVSTQASSDRTATLGELAVFVTSGSRGWARYYSESGPVFLRIGNLTREHINLRLDDLVHVRSPNGGEGARTRMLPGDLLISITADLGIIGLVPEGLGEGYVNQHIALVRLNTERINPRWAAYFLAGPTGASRFRRLNDMGAKAGLNLPTVSKVAISVPPRAVQDKAVAVLDAADIRIRAEEGCLSKLKLQKQGLMQDLLTGRVRVNA